MTANAIIFHGTGGNPNVAWYPWLAGRLTDRGYAVQTPHHPELNVEPVSATLPKVLAGHHFGERTVLVGHSGGAALLLALLEHLDVAVAQAILVAGYCTRPNDAAEPVLQDRYDWPAIKAHARELYFINSRTDPYGCDEHQGRAMFDRLGGTQIIRDDGHFGDYNQEYAEFPLVDQLVLRL